METASSSLSMISTSAGLPAAITLRASCTVGIISPGFSTRALAHRGFLNLLYKNKNQGRADFEEAALQNPDLDGQINNFAYDDMIKIKKDGQRAIKYATIACELSEWNDPNIIDTLAEAYTLEGNYEAAVKYQQQAVDHPELKPDDIKDFKDRLKKYRESIK